MQLRAQMKQECMKTHKILQKTKPETWNTITSIKARPVFTTISIVMLGKGRGHHSRSGGDARGSRGGQNIWNCTRRRAQWVVVKPFHRASSGGEIESLDYETNGWQGRWGSLGTGNIWMSGVIPKWHFIIG